MESEFLNSEDLKKRWDIDDLRLAQYILDSNENELPLIWRERPTDLDAKAFEAWQTVLKWYRGMFKREVIPLPPPFVFEAERDSMMFTMMEGKGYRNTKEYDLQERASLLNGIIKYEDYYLFSEESVRIFEEKEEIKTPSPKNLEILRCPRGEKWEWDEIKIRAISDHVVKITTPKGTESFNFGELGFANKKNPDEYVKEWGVLLIFCWKGGVLSDFHYDKIYKHISLLNGRLKEIFGIEQSFLEKGGYQKKKGYVSLTKFSDQRDQGALMNRDTLN